jgi:hypothetical protein
MYGVPVSFGPGEDSPGTGQYVWPGEAFDVCVEWNLDGSLLRPPKLSDKCQYVKLSDGRGWVRSRDKEGKVAVHSI